MARWPATTLALTLGLAAAACAERGPRTDPELLSNGSPFRYPIELWDAGTEGETVLMVRVTEAGRVDSAYVLDSSGHDAFDAAALAGARDLRFAPARAGDRRVTAWARLPVRFSRNDAPPPQRRAP